MTHLILTPGDPTGIGPEIAVKALRQLDEFANLRLTVIGSLTALKQAAAQLGVELPQSDGIAYQAVEDTQPGAVAYQSLLAAVENIRAGTGTALVTGPISKQNLQAAGHMFGGHTEVLEDLARRLWKQPKLHAEMLFVHGGFRLLLLTRHIPLATVPAALAQPGAVARPLKTLITYLRKTLAIETPRIAFLGVNPHAGESGGDEEKKYLLPVIHAVNGVGGSELCGPFPADGFFRGFDAGKPGYDAIVATYHDQGLIPFKLLAGHAAVNVTIGLPFLRTSVSHGTAADIVGRGVGDETSLLAALRVAAGN